MKTRTFRLDKLVRDKIVESTESQGGEVKYTELKGSKLTAALVNKLIEEAEELKGTEVSVSELADLQEILIALCDNNEIKASDLEEERLKKAAKNGRFKKGHFIHELTLPADNQWAKYYAADPKRFPEK